MHKQHFILQVDGQGYLLRFLDNGRPDFTSDPLEAQRFGTQKAQYTEKQQLERLGYTVQTCVLSAQVYPAPNAGVSYRVGDWLRITHKVGPRSDDPVVEETGHLMRKDSTGIDLRIGSKRLSIPIQNVHMIEKLKNNAEWEEEVVQIEEFPH